MALYFITFVSASNFIKLVKKSFSFIVTKFLQVVGHGPRYYELIPVPAAHHCIAGGSKNVHFFLINPQGFYPGGGGCKGGGGGGRTLRESPHQR